MEKITPLGDKHRKAGAQLTHFGGWEMPLRYKSELAEHQAVRARVGVFDLSHMGEFLVRGPGAFEFLQQMLTNDLRRIAPGKAQYTFLLNPEGGVLDDLIVYWLEPELFLLVVNAANTAKDWEWFQAHLPESGVVMQDITEETVLLALSGPESTAILRELLEGGSSVDDLPYYACRKLTVAGIPNVLVATTGYTGEWTYELFVRVSEGAHLWDAIVDRDVAPAGLAARNTLRLEMGYLLCGVDIDETTSPLEASAGWAVRLEKGDFIGKAALERQKAQGLPRKLVGLMSDSVRSLPRNGMPLLEAQGQSIGRITSGSISPTLQRGIALGYVPPTYKPGDTVYFSLRGQLVPLVITKPPFVSETSLTRRQKAAQS